jgi:ATP-binding cassette subfamily B multidrug efflux pump
MNNSPFKRLLGYALTDRKLLRQALILLLITTAADVAGPLLIKRFLDNHVVPGNWQMNAIALLGAAYLIFMLLAAGTNYLQAIRFNLIAQSSVQTLRRQVFDKVMQMPLSDFDRTPTGSLISRITNDTESIKELYVSVVGIAVQNAMRILGILTAMALLDWRLMIICLFFVPVVATLVYFYQRLSAPLFHRARSLLSDINARLHESFQGMKVIQLMAQEPRFRRDFGRLANEHYRARLRNVKLDSYLLRPMVDMIQTLILAGLLFSFSFRALNHPVEIGVIYAFVAYLGRFAEPLIEFTQRLNLYQQAIVAGERVFALLDQDNPTPLRDEHIHIETGKIEFNHVNFTYDGKTDVIKEVSFTIPPGSFHAIVGHTGSGKSTLMQLLLRFYQLQQGEIRIDEQPLEKFSEVELRKQVGIVQQDPFIFNSSVRDNIAMGHTLGDDAIHHAAWQAGLHEHVERLPQGYDTIMDERGSNFSTGQRQLLALARTLVHEPKILILDEATANIDSHTEAEIQKALLQLHGKVTLLVIAHRLSTIEKADEILVLHHGEVVQRGSHAALLHEDGIYKQLYKMQALGLEDE